MIFISDALYLEAYFFFFFWSYAGIAADKQKE